MNILAISRDAAELSRASTLLRELGHQVRTAKTDAEARAEMAANLPQVVLLALDLPQPAALELIKHVRKVPLPAFPYVMALAKPLQDEPLDQAYLAGCDGELRAPLSAAHVKARLATVERLCARLDPRAVVPANLPKTPFDPVIRSPAWGKMSDDLQAMATSFLGVEAKLAAVETAPGELSLARGILLSNVDHQLELRVGLATDKAGARALTMHMFGEDNGELQSDMLGELANMAMGALKASLAKESLAFTGGLPETVPADRFYQFGATSQHQASFVLVSGGVRLLVRIGLASKMNALVPASALREGMVLGKDVFNARGMLLAGAGTRLSSTAAERLRQALPEKQSVEVAAGVT